MAKKKQKTVTVSVGNVFAIPLGENKYGYGQVVGGGHPKTYVIYDLLADNHPNLGDITSKNIIYFAHTVDVSVEDGDWILLGNNDVPINIIFPEYIVDTPEGYFVTNYKGDLIRPALQSEEQSLQTRKSISPSILEDAVKARFGFEEWYPYLDKLKYHN